MARFVAAKNGTDTYLQIRMNNNKKTCESTGITSTSLHCVGGPLGPVVGFPMWATHTHLSQSLPYYSHPLSPSFNRSSAKIPLSPSHFEAVSPLQNKHGSFPQHWSGMLEPGLLSPNSRDVAKIIAFMEKTLWVNVISGGGGKRIIPFTSWVSFLSGEFLSEYFSWLVLAPPSRDLLIVSQLSDPLESLLEDCLRLGREEGYTTLTHQALFVQGCYDMKLELCFNSAFPLLFSLDILSQFNFSNICGQPFHTLPAHACRADAKWQSNGIWTHSPSLLSTLKARSALGGWWPRWG